MVLARRAVSITAHILKEPRLSTSSVLTKAQVVIPMLFCRACVLSRVIPGSASWVYLAPDGCGSDLGREEKDYSSQPWKAHMRTSSSSALFRLASPSIIAKEPAAAVETSCAFSMPSHVCLSL